jgi:hypothetical protein
MGRLGTRADIVVYQQYVNDIIDGVKKALGTVDPTPFFVKYGNNVWAASQQYLAAVVAYASGPAATAGGSNNSPRSGDDQSPAWWPT